MIETLLGSLVIALPALLVGAFLFWRNYRPVFWMLAGALIVGLGYLGVTGASSELGKPLTEALNSYQSTGSSTSAPAASTGAVSPPAGRYVTGP